jgi:hypothetical protein
VFSKRNFQISFTILQAFKKKCPKDEKETSKGRKRNIQGTKKKCPRDEKERAIPEILNKEYFRDYFKPLPQR